MLQFCLQVCPTATPDLVRRMRHSETGIRSASQDSRHRTARDRFVDEQDYALRWRSASSICLLSVNEAYSNMQRMALEEGLEVVVEVHDNKIHSYNEGKVIHFTGTTTTLQSIPPDPIFGVPPSDGAFKFQRYVQMYQWVESSHETEDCDGTTNTEYSYTTKWVDHVVHSSRFHTREGHENPISMMFPSETVIASKIDVGDFELSASVIGLMNWYQTSTTPLSTDSIPDKQVRGQAQVWENYVGHEYLYFSDIESNRIVAASKCRQDCNFHVGDTLVSFREVPQQTISVVAMQDGNQPITYSTRQGGHFLLVEPGVHNASDMFEHAIHG